MTIPGRERLAREIGDIPLGLLVGLTGGIASGKSTVAAMLVELGAVLVDFDLRARRVVEPGQPALGEIAALLGPQALDGRGGLDRKRVSALVFGHPDKLKALEAITHPRIFRRFLDELRAIGRDNPKAIVIADVPLLAEGDLGFLFDRVMVVHASPATQLARLTARDDIDASHARRIIAAQMPIDDKKALADFLIANQGDEAHTRRQVEAAWERMKELAARGRGR
jgi:dephospho-CoA kinase